MSLRSRKSRMPGTPHGVVPRRVLIVRPSALGDVARTVPALVTLRRALPNAHIDWLVHEAYVDVIRHHPALDGAVLFPRNRFSKLHQNPRIAREAWAWARRLRAQRYDLVIDLQGLFRSGLFTWLTGAGRRVGYANARECAWLGYNHRYRIDRQVHTVDRMLSLLEAEGLVAAHDMGLHLGPDDLQWLKDFLEVHGGSTFRYACVAPTARWKCKCWPIEYYQQIAQKLLETGLAGEKLVILAAPGERDQVRPIIDALGQTGRVIFPRTTVGQMMALLSRASLLVCNDSAALHIAVGFDRPIACVFGPTDPRLVGPYRRGDSIIQPGHVNAEAMAHYRHHQDDQSLIAQIPPQQVWRVVLEQLQRHPTIA